MVMDNLAGRLLNQANQLARGPFSGPGGLRMRFSAVATVLVVLSLWIPAGAQGEEPAAPPQRREWLVSHQDENGSWDPVRFVQHCEASGPCGGSGLAGDRVGTTGLALLCFLGYGETHKTPRYGDVVKKTLSWFKNAQQEDGAFEKPISDRFVLNHARATVALVELYGVTSSLLVKKTAQGAVDFLLSRRLKDGGWTAGADGKATDLETSTWAAMALNSAARAELEVGKDPFGSFLAWLDAGTDKETGRFGPEPKPAAEGRSVAETPTAMALVSRMMMGASREDPPFAKGIDLLWHHLPDAGEDGEDLDFSYTYFGSMVIWFAGIPPGDWHARGERFRDWSFSIKRAVVDNQCMRKESCTYGSWDPSSPSSREGRLGCTALGILTLTIYYR